MLKLLVLMPDIHGLSDIIIDLINKLGNNIIYHQRSNFELALKTAHHYDIIIVYQDTLAEPLTKQSFEQLHEISPKTIIISMETLKNDNNTRVLDLPNFCHILMQEEVVAEDIIALIYAEEIQESTLKETIVQDNEGESFKDELLENEEHKHEEHKHEEHHKSEKKHIVAIPDKDEHNKEKSQEDSHEINTEKVLSKNIDDNQQQPEEKIATNIKDYVLSDLEIKKSISLIKKSKKKAGKTFESIIKDYKKVQILYLISNLPQSVKHMLADNPTFQEYQYFLDPILNQEKQKPVKKEIPREKEIPKEKVIEKTQIVHSGENKRRQFTIVGNSEFCAELAYVTANHTKEHVLVIDADVSFATIHDIYGMQKLVNSDINIEDFYTESAFKQAHALAARNILNFTLFKNIPVSHRLNNLHVLTGNDVIETNETFTDIHFEQILKIAFEVYDYIFINVPRDLYDSYTIYSILLPRTTVIVPFDSSSIMLKNCMRFIQVLRTKQDLDIKNVKYVAYDYRAGESLNLVDIKRILSTLYLGSVQYDPSRVKARNDLKSGYAHKMNRKVESDYTAIMEKVGIKPHKNIIFKLSSLIRR